jgi:hypothetical protein
VSGWRERRDPVRPAAVRGVVRGVRTSLRATHAVESALLLVAATLLARAAMVVSEVEGPGAWGVALLCGALAAAAWWLEHPVALAALARELDRRLRHHGGLLTAFEIEERVASRPPTAMEELVRVRVLERLRRSEALHAMLPPLAIPIGAPVAAALLLLLAGDARRPEPRPSVDLGALADGLERALGLGSLDPQTAGIAGADEDGGLSRAQVQALQRVLSARDALPRTAAGWEAPDLAARVAELDRRVTALADEVDRGSALHARLAEARPWLDALRTGLAPEGASPDGAGATEVPAPDGPLTAGAPDGTISGSSSPSGNAPMPSDPSAPAAPAPGTAAPGLQAGSWWPAEYDAVVAAWVERSRAEQGPRAAPR